MKRLIIICTILFIIVQGYAQSPVFQWARKTSGGVGEEVGNSIAPDNNGNIYTAGYFNGTVDFDPGPGVFTMTSAGNDDAFLLKLDVSGNFLWARQIGGASYDNAATVSVNATGEVYITGGFYGTVDFDPGPGIYNLTDFGGGDIYVSKFDAGGNLLWARQLGGAAGDYVNSMAVDAAGNVYTTGGINDVADFDPGVSVYNLTPISAGDVFISKLNAAGNFEWAKQLGGSSAFDYGFGYSIAVDPAGNVYSTGSFSGAVDFDPGAGNSLLTSTGGDVYISKLDNSGNFLWAKEFAGVSAFDYGYSYSLAVNGSNVYISGYFAGNMDFDPGAGSQVLSSVAGSDDIFIVKLDTSGNYSWSKQVAGSSYEYTYGIALDAGGNVYTTGYFSATVDFDPGPAVLNLTSSAGSPDIFILKLDPAGNFTWAKQMGSTNFDIGNSLTVDGSNNIFTTGSFKNTVDFDPGAGVFNLTSSGSSDLFIQKMSQASVLPVEWASFTGNRINNINRLEWITATEHNNAFFTLERSNDGLIFEPLSNIPGAGNSSGPLHYRYEDKNAFFPITYYRLKQTNLDGNSKYSGVISIRAGDEGSRQIISVFPNPVTDKIRFVYHSGEKNVLCLQLVNNTGAVLKIREQKVEIGENTITVSVGEIPAGIYLIKVLAGNGYNQVVGSFIKN
jgi:hypothetical protein